jgi:hypothetical protein
MAGAHRKSSRLRSQLLVFQAQSSGSYGRHSNTDLLGNGVVGKQHPHIAGAIDSDTQWTRGKRGRSQTAYIATRYQVWDYWKEARHDNSAPPLAGNPNSACAIKRNPPGIIEG